MQYSETIVKCPQQPVLIESYVSNKSKNTTLEITNTPPSLPAPTLGNHFPNSSSSSSPNSPKQFDFLEKKGQVNNSNTTASSPGKGIVGPQSSSNPIPILATKPSRSQSSGVAPYFAHKENLSYPSQKYRHEVNAFSQTPPFSNIPSLGSHLVDFGTSPSKDPIASFASGLANTTGSSPSSSSPFAKSPPQISVTLPFPPYKRSKQPHSPRGSFPSVLEGLQDEKICSDLLTLVHFTKNPSRYQQEQQQEQHSFPLFNPSDDLEPPFYNIPSPSLGELEDFRRECQESLDKLPSFCQEADNALAEKAKPVSSLLKSLREIPN